MQDVMIFTLMLLVSWSGTQETHNILGSREGEPRYWWLQRPTPDCHNVTCFLYSHWCDSGWWRYWWRSWGSSDHSFNVNVPSAKKASLMRNWKWIEVDVKFSGVHVCDWVSWINFPDAIPNSVQLAGRAYFPDAGFLSRCQFQGMGTLQIYILRQPLRPSQGRAFKFLRIETSLRRCWYVKCCFWANIKSSALYLPFHTRQIALEVMSEHLYWPKNQN